MNELARVKQFFQGIQIPLSSDWLQSCIEWCKSESLGPGHTERDLQMDVYQQWLLLDLRDVKVASLPPNLSNMKHYVLNGNYCLQVMQTSDISKPKLSQLQKIRNAYPLTKNVQEETENLGKRMLQLVLTDGVQDVDGMEYRTIPSLSINLQPGVKLRIMGPVDVRRGCIMLQSQHVKILGGEVEELLVPNAAENVLARALSLPLNPTPKTVDETEPAPQTIDEVIPAPIPFVPATVRNVPERPAPIQSTAPARNIAPPTSRNVPVRQNSNSAMTEEEELAISEEIKLMLELEQEHAEQEENRSNKPNPNQDQLRTTPDLFEDDMHDFNPNDFQDIESAATSTQLSPMQPASVVRQNLANNFVGESFSPKPTKTTKVPSFDEDDDVFKGINIDAHLDQLDRQMAQPTVPKFNTVPISRLLRNKDNITKGVFRVKAKFKSVVEKLTLSEEGHRIVIAIDDGADSLDVRIHSDLLTEFLGYCPEAIEALRREILEKNASAKEKLINAMLALKDKLVKLEGIVQVQIAKSEPHPVLMSIIQPT